MHISYKNQGETPLECLERIRLEKGIDLEIPMTYAGRLDPMAEGMMIFLVGKECKEKEKYTSSDKEYEIEILIGVKTDSYDLLGMIESVDLQKKMPDMAKYIGKFDQKYPEYSSKVIAMKEIPEDMPSKEVEIYSIESLESRLISGGEIAKQTIEKINKVKGNFRQDKIIEGWKEFGKTYGKDGFKIIKLMVACSSGTYMRALANNLGGLAFSIKRTKIMIK